ncbi:MAG: PAS domain S-box protein [Crocinitomicaceae bacterium]|nr:PAS domain S-box protein [Crocinitomicaceae bacterium]
MISNSSKSNYLYDLPDENPNGVISFDSKLNLLYSNNSAKKKFLSDFDVNTNQIKDKDFKNELKGFLKSKKKESLFHLERNGRTYSISFKLISPQNYIHVYATDISSYIKQIKKKDIELEKLSLLAKRTNNGVLTLDKNKKITWANKSFIKRSGYSITELNGKDPLSFIHKAIDKKTIEQISKKMSLNEFVREEVLHKSKQGDFYWVDLTVNSLYDNEGVHNGYMLVEFDITDRKQNEQIIKEQNKSLLEITDALDKTSLVAVSSLNGTIIRTNDNFRALSKYSENELIGTGFSLLNSEYHSNDFWKKMWSEIKKGKTWRSEIRNKAKDGSYFWVDLTIHPIYNNKKQITHYLTIGYDISPRKEVQQTLIDTARFQDLLMKISSVYINIPLDTLEKEIVVSLEIIGKFINVERVYVFEYNHQKKCASNLFEWCAEGISPQMQTLQAIPFDKMPIWRKRHFKGKEIHIPDIQKLARGKFRKIIESQEIKSLISIPMMDGKKCLGFVGFDSVREKRSYTEEEKSLLKLYAQMLVNVSNRVDHIKQIEESKKQIEEINANLEQIVIDKTKKNLQLSRSIANQEKMVTIGEISAGIAHDLNTPLGAIKIGAESLLYSLQGLFKGTFSSSSEEQLNFAYAYASKILNDKELFVGGLKARKERKVAYEYLLEKNLPKDIDVDKFADFMVKNRVNVNNHKLLNKVLNSSNPLAFMELIYHAVMLRSFIQTIMVSGEKATKVVQDLRSFIKDPVFSEKRDVVLKKSIATVLNIFNYELKKNIEVKFDVDESLSIQGYDIKLFQLWSNLIKNAIESMESLTTPKKLSICAERNEKHIELIFENNGPEIEKKVLNQIFDKFFTTKAHKNGTGLGLSIVKNVIDEHDAKITVISKKEATKFIIYFPL